MIEDSLNAINPDLKPFAAKRIIVTGGLSQIPGFVNKLKSHLQSTSSDNLSFDIKYKSDPMYFLENLKALSRNSQFSDMILDRKKYEEYGSYRLVKELGL